MKAAVQVADRNVQFLDVDEPSPGRGQVLVRSLGTSICGSDQHVFKGEFAGRVQYPHIGGHEFFGRVEKAGDGVESLAVGDRVAVDPLIWCNRCRACLEGCYSACSTLKLLGIDLAGGYAELVCADQEKCFKLPDSIPDEHGPLVELYSVGVHVTRRTRVDPGDCVVILGSGKVGMAILDVIKETAALTVAIVDIIDARLQRARRIHDKVELINAREVDPVQRVMELTDGRGAERVIEVVGHYDPVPGREEPMVQAVKMLRSAGRLVAVGQADEPAQLMSKLFVWKEAELIASRVNRGEFPRAIDLMQRRRVSPDLLITDRIPISEAQQAYEMLERQRDRHVKIVMEPGR
jgi:threonine dehydrogenase-like Zn-dependent dehydrogenase